MGMGQMAGCRVGAHDGDRFNSIGEVLRKGVLKARYATSARWLHSSSGGFSVSSGACFEMRIYGCFGFTNQPLMRATKGFQCSSVSGTPQNKIFQKGDSVHSLGCS